jgi:hypothetical protein
MDNLTGKERTTNPTALDIAGRDTFQLNHPVRWLYNPMQNVAVEWLNPVSAAPTGVLNTAFGMHAVGVVTGHRRSFFVPVQFTTNALGLTQNVASNTQTMGNPGDQPYLIENFLWSANGVGWSNLNDTRVVNHLRTRIRPTSADAWSDLPVPVLFYGVHKGIPNRAVWYKPPGGPILLRKNQQVVFELANAGAGFALNGQVALIGRVAPGITDVV